VKIQLFDQVLNVKKDTFAGFDFFSENANNQQ